MTESAVFPAFYCFRVRSSRWLRLHGLHQESAPLTAQIPSYAFHRTIKRYPFMAGMIQEEYFGEGT